MTENITWDTPTFAAKELDNGNSFLAKHTQMKAAKQPCRRFHEKCSRPENEA
ncbi:MAG: hypothetical protein K9J37_05555 [Saprospiraceae bacterium]|nr:hypothetical protein [Saprospiraceae bacterium]MCF8249356.1 hypothetical protein [Saprospiraceae bacterium]MCF8279008.1 hypothetical protein [Bacteroidales bacterium]MCF8311485.1 hypothetical protein [Saprospiraceae bacterium]MCF8439975.1 hypothetical protein [Saprospiraceae bacterium]